MNLFSKKSANRLEKSVNEAADKIKNLAADARKRYDQVDERTKKKTMAALGGAAVLIAAGIGAKKMMEKHKK